MQKTKKLYKKKGQSAVGAMIALIVGVGVGTLVLIFVGALGGQTYNLVETDLNDISGKVVNEKINVTNGVETSFGYDGVNEATLALGNQTEPVGVGNFTIDYAEGKLTLNTATYDGQEIIANYTFGDSSIETSLKAGIVSAFEAQEQTGEYMPIMVLAVVIGLVLTIVLGFTAFGNGGGRSVL